MNNMQIDETRLDGWELMLLRTAHEMSLSEAQYTLISDRYTQLQSILSAATDPILQDAHIFIQGSIRLKTTIKPAPGAENEMATIDADAIVWLPHAQSADAAQVLKAIEERFRKGVRVDAPIEPLRRGIRIVYADENPGFHIDVTPARCAPGNADTNGAGNLQVPDRVVGWKASSPILYSDWLAQVAEKQIQLVGLPVLSQRQVVLAEATQDPIPDYEEYTDANPLRAAIKLIKRHRDEWAIRESKQSVRPISAVLTTLAGLAYAEIAVESQHRPFRPVEAIIEIVERMPKFIGHDLNGHYVCNPMDAGENFAEKWNRPGLEGIRYKRAFDEWHTTARRDIRLGFTDFGSTEGFAVAMSERFGIGRSVVESVVRQLPTNLGHPGRALGTTSNSLRLQALVGGTAASSSSQSSVRPVDRLG